MGGQWKIATSCKQGGTSAAAKAHQDIVAASSASNEHTADELRPIGHPKLEKEQLLFFPYNESGESSATIVTLHHTKGHIACTITGARPNLTRLVIHAPTRQLSFTAHCFDAPDSFAGIKKIASKLAFDSTSRGYFTSVLRSQRNVRRSKAAYRQRQNNSDYDLHLKSSKWSNSIFRVPSIFASASLD